MNIRKSTLPQKHNNTIIFVIYALTTFVFFCQALANSQTNDLQKDSALKVYLPRATTIEDDIIKLGQVSVIRGEDSFVAAAREITLGRISVAGQEIVIDRPMVLSRLACNGIPASEVTLTGAEKITVKRQEQIIKADEFVELASEFLKKNPDACSVCQLDAVQRPKDFIVPKASGEVELSPRLAEMSAPNLAKVQIVVLQDGKQAGEREVAFRLKYNCRSAVALVDIPAGTVISRENVKIENTVTSNPESADWKPPYGLVAKRNLPAKTLLNSSMLSAAKSAVVVKRNQNVVICIERPGLVVTAIGKTLQDGRAGEYIKVRNIDSQRIILTKVNEDGTVEPVF